MIRVDKIEHQSGIEVADSSLSSSSTSTPDDKQKRLPSDLSVSILVAILTSFIYMNFRAKLVPFIRHFLMKSSSTWKRGLFVRNLLKI